MKIDQSQIPAGISSIAITLTEELAQAVICALMPKLVVAIQTDLNKLDKLIHPFEAVGLKMALKVCEEVLVLASCPAPPVTE